MAQMSTAPLPHGRFFFEVSESVKQDEPFITARIPSEALPEDCPARITVALVRAAEVGYSPLHFIPFTRHPSILSSLKLTRSTH